MLSPVTAGCIVCQVSLKEFLRALLAAGRFFEFLEPLLRGCSVRARGGRSEWPALEPSALDSGNKPMIRFLPELAAMRAFHRFDLVGIAHAASLTHWKRA